MMADLSALSALGLAGLAGVAGLPLMGGMGVANQMGGCPSGNELPMNTPTHGVVKAWMDEKGFGFVTPSMGGPDVFVHRNQLTDGERLVQGNQVTFECRFNPSRMKYEATSCSGASVAGASVDPAMAVAANAAAGKGVAAIPGKASWGTQDNLFIAGMPMDFTEDKIKELFAPYGTVINCKVLPDQPGRTDKAALVRFADENQAKWMVQNMHGNVPVGMATPLVIRYAGEKAKGPIMGKVVTPMAPMLQDNRFSPYGGAGGAHFPGLAGLNQFGGASVDPNLTASLMQLMAGGAASPLAAAPAIGQLDASSLQLLAGLQGGLGGLGLPASQPAGLDPNVLAAATANTMVGNVSSVAGAIPATSFGALQVGNAPVTADASNPAMAGIATLAPAVAGLSAQAAAAPAAAGGAVATSATSEVAAPLIASAPATTPATATAAALVAAAGAAVAAPAAAQATQSTQSIAAPATTGSWAEAKDPNTGKTYFYHTVTRETRWEKPAESN